MKKLFDRKDEIYKFVTPTPTKDTCPYCGYKFEKTPTRKKKCPECGNDIFVRGGELFTKEEKDISDWLSHYNTQELGITRDVFNKTRQELSRELGSIASVNDTFWRILNVVNSPDKSYRDRRLIYQLMSFVLKSEGKNARRIKVEIEKMGLLEYKQDGIKRVVIETRNDENVCDQCKKLRGKVFDIDDALREMPIPNECENDECRCWYSHCGYG